MRTQTLVWSLCLASVALLGCDSGHGASPSKAPSQPMPSSSTLFADAPSTTQPPSEPHVARSRFVTVNLALLMDDAGRARDVREVTLNLFPDVVYRGVIEQIEQNGDECSWVGVLKDVEYSHLTMVFTSGVFIGHFASPLGVYEVSIVEGDLYRIILIDQSKLREQHE
jgi:hypothetical protein